MPPPLASAEDLLELEDGGVFVPDPGGLAAEDWFENLAEVLDEQELSEIGLDLSQKVEQDKTDLEDRREMYARGLERTGVGVEAPGGADFPGAHRVTHPALTAASVDYSARTLRELLPPGGAAWFAGSLPEDVELPPGSQERADAKANKLDKLFRRPELGIKRELEQLVIQEGLAGSQYARVIADRRRKLATVKFVPADFVILPAAATSYAAAFRKTISEALTLSEVVTRQEAGQYRKVDLVASSTVPDRTRPDEVAQRAAGVGEPATNEDDLIVLYETEEMLQLGDDEEPGPYLVTWEEQSSTVLSVYRNWREDDPTRTSIVHVIEWPFLPWRGAYSIGLLHLIGGLAAASTGALRALLDAALTNNTQTGVHLEGATAGGQSINLRPTEVKALKTNNNSDDIRKVYLPLPYNPPSPVLFQLLEFCVNAAAGMVRATLQDEPDGSPNVPVGTTLARIDEATVVFGSIFGRQIDALMETARLVGRVQAELDPARFGDLADLSDVAPVADPNVFTESKRAGQLAAVQQRAALLRQQGLMIYDERKLEERFLKQIKVPNWQELLVKQPTPQRLDAVSENVAATMGMAIIAFPDQDHASHLDVHLPYLKSPVLGSLPTTVPAFMPKMLEHLKQHVAYWYAQLTYDIATRTLGAPIEAFSDRQDPQLLNEVDGVMAAASRYALQVITRRLDDMGLGQLVTGAMQLLEQLTPQPMSDPALMAEVKRKARADEMRKDTDDKKLQLAGTQTQAEVEQADAQRALDAAEAEAARRAEAERAAEAEVNENLRKMADLQTREKIADEANAVKLEIADAANEARVEAAKNKPALTAKPVSDT